MNKKTKNIFYISLSLIAIIIAIQLIKSANNIDINKYKTYEISPLTECFEVDDLNNVMKFTDLVVVGTVKEEPTDFRVKYTPNPDTPEYAILEKQKNKGIKKALPGVSEIRIDIEKVLYGNISDDSLMFLQSETNKGYEPELSKGDKMVFFLEKVEDTGAEKEFYIPVHPHAGYWYITDNDKVIPVYRKNEYETLIGITIDDLRKKINK